jgi:hypothetical protein
MIKELKRLEIEYFWLAGFFWGRDNLGLSTAKFKLIFHVMMIWESRKVSL